MKAHFDPQWPRWNNPICPRVSGFSDGVLHKVGLLSGQEEKRVCGGRIRVQAERFKAYEAQVERRLLTLAAPLLQEAGQLAAEVETGSIPRTDTTRGTRQAARQQAARQRLVELDCTLQNLVRQADCAVDEALCRANTYLSKYAKASRFSVLEKEIPRLSRSRRFEVSLGYGRDTAQGGGKES